MSQGQEGSPRNSTTNNVSTQEDLDFQRRNKLWVVLVDDEESIRFAVGDFLYDRGYEVTACADAKSLLDLIVLKNKGSAIGGEEIANHRLPDLVISDVRMPESDKNGYELVEFLRSADTSIEDSPLNQRSLVSLKNVPIVLLTAKAMTDDRIMGYKAGADVVLPKPFSPEELVSIIDSLILRRQQRLKPKEAPQSTFQNQEDIRIFRRELAEIKAIVKKNAATTVQKTHIVLTDKERVIMELLSKGYTPREIASEVLRPKASSNGEKQDIDREEVALIRKTIEGLVERTETESKTEQFGGLTESGTFVSERASYKSSKDLCHTEHGTRAKMKILQYALGFWGEHMAPVKEHPLWCAVDNAVIGSSTSRTSSPDIASQAKMVFFS
eukprot:CAMPEP_0116134492 /NCGR_PEP_ID=MMETSP0329-20121206/10673_1 /TAXON_ID=697910 /ORGANISM="Pseudo-nitzschia arenysensis, Strain B593" /LENGTH=383 /DNA_ID=CAMNT_0003629203 /DNA_START=252 /DNA_END=1401 /DNA_ORIENTATION=+